MRTFTISKYSIPMYNMIQSSYSIILLITLLPHYPWTWIIVFNYFLQISHIDQNIIYSTSGTRFSLRKTKPVRRLLIRSQRRLAPSMPTMSKISANLRTSTRPRLRPRSMPRSDTPCSDWGRRTVEVRRRRLRLRRLPHPNQTFILPGSQASPPRTRRSRQALLKFCAFPFPRPICFSAKLSEWVCPSSHSSAISLSTVDRRSNTTRATSKRRSILMRVW